MAQGNVAREPSMDEILASIRRIIESNEIGGPGQPANDLGPRHGAAAEEVHLTVDDDLRLPAFGEDAYEAPARPAAPGLPQAASAAAANPPLSLADVAARVRAASERSVAARIDGAADSASRPAAAAAAPQLAPVANSFAPPSPVVPVAGLEPARPLPSAGSAFDAFERGAGNAPTVEPAAPAPRSFEQARVVHFDAPPAAEAPRATDMPAFAPSAPPVFAHRSDAAPLRANALDLPFDDAMALRQPALQTVNTPALTPLAAEETDFDIVTDLPVPPADAVEDALHAAADAFEAELDAHEAATTELAGPHADRAASAETHEPDHLDAVAGIISPVVGEHVAHAFEQLAIAVDSKPRRSFDEIAQDMLRPMLQEWMDDNLPTLVERLVREEIERVARGPRR